MHLDVEFQTSINDAASGILILLVKKLKYFVESSMQYNHIETIVLEMHVKRLETALKTSIHHVETFEQWKHMNMQLKKLGKVP